MPNFDSEKIGFLNFQIFPMIHAVYTIANSTDIDYTTQGSGDMELKISN